MDFSVKTREVCEKNIIRKETAEQAIDCDITLPEYFPAIQRVVKCALTPCLANVQKAGGRITAEGAGILSVLYLSEENSLRCFVQNIPFSRFVEARDLEDAECSVRARTEYVNCRVMSGCRIDVHGSISLRFTCFARAEQKVLCGCEGKGVQIKTQKTGFCNLTDCCERGFTVSETFELGSGRPSALQLIRSEATAVLEDTKIVSGKILLKGEVRVRTLYIAETDGETLQSAEHTMPLSQIIDVEGAQDGCIDCLELVVSGLEVSARTDAAGALRLLEVTADLRVSVETYMQGELESVSDAYSTLCEIGVKRKNIRIRRLCDRFSDTCLCRSECSFSGASVAQILDLSAGEISCTPTYADGELELRGTVTAELLVRFRDGTVSSTTRQLDYEYRRSLDAGSGPVECCPSLTVTGTSFLLNGDDKLDIRVEIDITAAVFTVCSLCAVTEIVPDVNSPKPKSAAALTIYFSEAGESVWDIARRYNTTVSAILLENRLTDETIAEKRRLLIPRA